MRSVVLTPIVSTTLDRLDGRKTRDDNVDVAMTVSLDPRQRKQQISRLRAS